MQETENSKKLQRQYFKEMDEAYKDHDLNGNYTAAGVRHLIAAAESQKTLSLLTEGAASGNHKHEYERLVHVVREECERLGIDTSKSETMKTGEEKTIRESSAVGEHGNVKSDDKKISNPPGKKVEFKYDSDETGVNFHPDDYVLKSDTFTLDNLNQDKTYIQLIRKALDPNGFMEMFPKATESWKKNTTRNFLFYGPPGTGKSQLCKAICASIHEQYGEDSVFILVSASAVISKYRGTTEQRLRALFRYAECFTFAAICIDEFEQLCPAAAENNYNYSETFRELIDGIGGQTRAMIVACTNYPKKIDLPIMSRLGTPVFIDYPTAADIEMFFCGDKACVDCMGTDAAEAEKNIRTISASAADKRYSYRNLQSIASLIQDTALRKTLKQYPDGNPDLEHVIPLNLSEAEGIIASEKSDYNPELYATYLDFQNE